MFTTYVIYIILQTGLEELFNIRQKLQAIFSKELQVCVYKVFTKIRAELN